MNKVNLKKNISRFLVLVIGVYIIYSISVHLEYRHYINQSLDRNYQVLSFISAKGHNLANNLHEFTQLPIEQEKISEVKSKMFNNWRIVNGESKSIYNNLATISTLHMGDEASIWDILRYSLIRADSFIFGMTNKFLENQSYAVSSEELAKLEAVIVVYKTLYEETEKESFEIDLFLQSIKEPMQIIDEYYQATLESIGK